MKCHRIDLKLKGRPEQIEIMALCCMHIGHVACDYVRIGKMFKWLLAGDNRFCFDLGDDTENAVPGDEEHNSMMWDSNMHPEEQFRKAADLLLPVAKAGKLIITHNSNHWWRSQAKTGFNIPKQLNTFLQQMGLQDPHPDALPRWGGWQALTSLGVGKQNYMIHSWHGAGGSATPEGALRKCRSMAVNHDADIYLCGHFHQKIAWQDNHMRWSGNGLPAKEMQRTFACTGGFLGWHEGYAERKGLPPNRRGSIVLRLGVKEWDVKVGL